jgi:hypothetical protein
MTDHKTGTQKERLAARLDLLQAEKALTRRSDELARRRQELPWVSIDKDYRANHDVTLCAVSRCRGVAVSRCRGLRSRNCEPTSGEWAGVSPGSPRPAATSGRDRGQRRKPVLRATPKLM